MVWVRSEGRVSVGVRMRVRVRVEVRDENGGEVAGRV